MKFPICYSAIGLALVAGASTANAQTVITRQISDPAVTTVVTQPAPPVVSEDVDGTVVQPMQTVQTFAPAQTVQTTTRTVRTERVAPRAAHRQVVTTRTVTRRLEPSPTIAETISTAPQPLYDVVQPGPVAVNPNPPLYDEVMSPAPAVADAVVDSAAPFRAEPFIYRYVYQPDRILVIDPRTGVAVQSIPR